jgi:uncharacterized protein (TIGR02466 family)
MTIEVFSLFPTPLLKTRLERNNNDILSFTKKEKFRFLEKVKNGYISENVYVLEEPELKSLRDDIQDKIDFFVYEVIGLKRDLEFYFTNSWIIKHQTGHWSQNHYHANSLLSGVYYFDVNEESGPITFHKSDAYTTIFSRTFDFRYEKETPFNTKRTSITPNNGDLIIFPSHLSHSVDENRSEQDRYCLPFNVFVRGNLGSDFDFNRLQFK